MKTAGVVLATRAGNALLAFVISVVIARTLGPAGRAEYFLVATLAAGAFAIAGLSQDQAITWAIAERKSPVRRILRTLRPVTIVLCSIGIGLYLLVALPGGVLEAVPRPAVLLGAVLVPLMMIRLLQDAILFASQRARIASVSLVVASAVQLVAVLALWVFDRLDPATVIATSGLSTAVGIAVCWPAMRELRAAASSSDDALPPRDLVRVGATNHVGLVALWFALRIDVFIVAALVDKDRLGVYTLAVTLGELVLLATDAVALTALSRQVALPRDASERFGVGIAADSVRVALFQMIGLALIGWPVIRFVFGAEWTDAYYVFLALGPGLAGYAYLRPIGLAFIRAGRSGERSIALGIAAAGNVVGTSVLVPIIGIVGGGIASTLGYLAGAFFLAYRTKRSFGGTPWSPSIIWPWLKSALWRD